MKKVTVNLRSKPVNGGRRSLYLDFHPPVKKANSDQTSRREFLYLYIHDDIEYQKTTITTERGNTSITFTPKLNKKNSPVRKKLTPIQILENDKTMRFAIEICNARRREVNQGEVLTNLEKSVQERDTRERKEEIEKEKIGSINFIQYFEQQAKKRAESSRGSWDTCQKYLELFGSKSLTVKEINEKFCNDFREFLLKSTGIKRKSLIKQNSASVYFIRFKTTLKQAYKDGLLSVDLNKKVDGIPTLDTKREFLTLDELRDLSQKDCNIPILKKAALFSALTGLRAIDIKKLKWSEVRNDNGVSLHFKQQKTEGQEVQPISEQAFQLLGDRGMENDLVFPGFELSSHIKTFLTRWVRSAKIEKNISFHCFRHTFATLQLTFGTDIYTISKMLGHRDVKTTQIYTKVVDKVKRAAADKIKI